MNILENKESFLITTLELFNKPKPTEIHQIYYCLPIEYMNKAKAAIEEELQFLISLRKARTTNQSLSGNNNNNINNNNQTERKVIRKDWLPPIESILNITKERTCIERKSVKSELLPDVDYAIIPDQLNENLSSLYKVHSAFQFPHLPKIGVINSNGKISYERELPSYQVKLKGISNTNTDIVVKLSPYTHVSEFINFILYKNHIQGQFKSIELFENSNTFPVQPNQMLSSLQSNNFTLFFSVMSKRRRTVEIHDTNAKGDSPKRKSLGRVLSPHMKELWSCIEVDSV